MSCAGGNKGVDSSKEAIVEEVLQSLASALDTAIFGKDEAFDLIGAQVAIAVDGQQNAEIPFLQAEVDILLAGHDWGVGAFGLWRWFVLGHSGIPVVVFIWL